MRYLISIVILFIAFATPSVSHACGMKISRDKRKKSSSLSKAFQSIDKVKRKKRRPKKRRRVASKKPTKAKDAAFKEVPKKSKDTKKQTEEEQMRRESSGDKSIN